MYYIFTVTNNSKYHKRLARKFPFHSDLPNTKSTFLFTYHPYNLCANRNVCLECMLMRDRVYTKSLHLCIYHWAMHLSYHSTFQLWIHCIVSGLWNTASYDSSQNYLSTALWVSICSVSSLALMTNAVVNSTVLSEVVNVVSLSCSSPQGGRFQLAPFRMMLAVAAFYYLKVCPFYNDFTEEF